MEAAAKTTSSALEEIPGPLKDEIEIDIGGAVMKAFFRQPNRQSKKAPETSAEDYGLEPAWSKKLEPWDCLRMATECVSIIQQSGKFELLLMYLREESLKDEKVSSALKDNIFRLLGARYPEKAQHYDEVYEFLIGNRQKWIDTFGEQGFATGELTGSQLPPRPKLQDETVEKIADPKPREVILTKDVRVAGASVVGGAHIGTDVFVGRNNQDAMMLTLNDDAAILAVCDGCSAAKHSDVGSKILVKCLTNAFIKHGKSGTPEEIVAKVQAELISKLNSIIDTMVSDDESRAEIVEDYFPATAIGAYMTPKGGFFWGLGDGVFGYGIENSCYVEVVEAPEKDKPSYLAYHLLEEWPSDVTKKHLAVYDELDRIPDRFFVGSDGVKDFIALSGKKYPGADDKIPSIEQLLLNDRCFDNPTELSRILKRIQTVHTRPSVVEKKAGSLFKTVLTTEVSINSEGRLLPDDTTILAASLKQLFPGQFIF